MHPPSRTRRIFKWTGAGLSLLILSIWGLTLWWPIRSATTASSFVWLDNGSLLFMVKDYGMPPSYDSPYGLKPSRGFADYGFILPRWTFQEFPEKSWYAIVIVPLWLPLLLTAIPTAWLWHRDRRRIRPGCCLRCGYDLTGNTSGVCSECGLAKPPPATV